MPTINDYAVAKAIRALPIKERLDLLRAARRLAGTFYRNPRARLLAIRFYRGELARKYLPDGSA